MLERRHCQPAASDDAGSCVSRRKQRWLGALKQKRWPSLPGGAKAPGIEATGARDCRCSAGAQQRVF